MKALSELMFYQPSLVLSVHDGSICSQRFLSTSSIIIYRKKKQNNGLNNNINRLQFQNTVKITEIIKTGVIYHKTYISI